MIDQPIYDRRYRGWCVPTQKMEYNFSFAKRIDYICDYKLMMSTTLCDINNKEIFEGDIIRDISSGIRYFVKYGIYKSENYSAEGIGFYLRGEKIERVRVESTTVLYEVIGNIFEDKNILV